MNDKAKLIDGEIIPVTDILEWARWYNTADRRVALTTIGIFEVSTVSLGLDHAFGGNRPLWFETMVFCGNESEDRDGWFDRYSTLEEAMQGHERIVGLVKEANP